MISWSADFQHLHYSEFFSKKQILGWNTRLKNTLRNTHNLLLSSHNARKDLGKFFQTTKGLKIHIFHFVSIIDDLEQVDIEDLRKKYHLPESYFLISNQFHKHKNHGYHCLPGETERNGPSDPSGHYR